MVLALALLLCNPGNSYAGETDTSVIYVVKRGDTLGGIALRYKISVKQLRRWNRLRGDKIFEGQRLELWPHSSSVCYVVRSGDTLSEIAAQCGVSLSTLRSLNHIYKDRIYPGQKIKFAKPLEKTEVVDEPFEYVVKKGDNLSTIAQRFDVGLSFLRQLNHLKHDRIYPGQRLQLRPSSLDEAVHVVRPGDTLSSIALKYRIKLSELMELNDIEGSKILVGQKLRLKTT
ncbi:MAG: LysM peptidoglycan-binding domain-containing protein, partial [Desulfobacterales bacterium]|nr:LysM peptidoglycan-binding domain-containing protein [Desulfobacterales bacterium]